MENTIFDGGQETSAAYDYRLYDRVWKRVSPGVDPYAEDPAGGDAAGIPTAPAQPPAVSAAAPAPVQATGVSAGGEAGLPGAERNPCCMGTDAQDSLEVVEGFLEEELAGRRHYLALACCLRNQQAVRLLRRAAAEKQGAVRELCAAYYLITGNRYASAVAAEHLQFDSPMEALRACYHQEACNGFNYQRSADETMDPCLQKLFDRLGDQSYRRSEEIMALLGRILC